MRESKHVIATDQTGYRCNFDIAHGNLPKVTVARWSE